MIESRASAAPDWRLELAEPARRRLRIWLWSIVAVTFAVLVVGGITRLTQSGLSITEWRPLTGIVPPTSEAAWQEMFDRYRQFPEYQQLRQGMSLAEFKTIFFWEYLHRALARLIGVVFVVPFVVFWMTGHLTRPIGLRTLGLFALGAMQGILGWLMVQSGLVDRPSVSHYRLAAHLSLAFIIVGASVWLARDLALRPVRAALAPAARGVMWRGLVLVGVLLAAQVVWGALVAGLDAGYLFATFPLMGGRLFPPGMWALSPGALNLVQNLATVQWMHRLLGTCLLAVVVVLFFVVRASAADRRSRRFSAALASLVALQYVLGILTLIYFVPVTLGVLHQATALVIAVVWVMWAHHVRRTPLLE